MKTKVIRVLALFVLIALSLFPGQAFAADDIEVIVTRHAGTECRLTTFEGAGDFQPINPDMEGLIPELNARFESGWYTLTSVGDLNNPSPPTIAFWVDNNNDVTFEEPVAAVSFYYSSTVPLSLYGIDENGAVVVSIDVPATDPSGDFSIWEPCGVTVGTNNTGDNIISKLRITGSPGYVFIDDFKTCTVFAPPEKAPPLRIDLVDDHFVNYDNSAKTIVLDMSSKWV